jgi:hypothetical protein
MGARMMKARLMRAYAVASVSRIGIRLGVAIGVALTLAAPPVEAQQVTDVKQVLYRMANSLGMLRTVRELDSVMTFEYWATGTVREVGPKTIAAPVQVKSYYAQIAYDFPGMRVDVTRASGTPAREIQVVSGAFAWNEDRPGAGLVAGEGTAVPVMDAVTDRLLQLWTTPFGVVKAATAAGAQAKVSVENGAVVVTFPLVSAAPGETVNMVVGDLSGTAVKVTLNAEYRPERVELRHGGRVFTTTYSGYADLNERDLKADIFFPARIVRTVDGQAVLDLTVQRTNTYNPYVLVPVPDSVQKTAAR